MDNFQIETAQNVRIKQNVANIGDRILAFLIDVLILFAFETVLVLALRGMDVNLSEKWMMILVFGLPVFLYHLLWESFNNGQSPGKAVIKIKVVKLDGSKPSFFNYLVRWLLRIIDISITSGAVAIVTILLSGRGQRLGDLAAQTTVISERDSSSFHKTLLVDIPPDYSPHYPQVTIFSDKDIQSIKNIFTEAKRNRNNAVILALHRQVTEKLEVEPKEKPVIFIEKVITDYNFYTQQ